MPQFFDGEQEIDRLVVAEPPNGATECVITAMWEPLLSRTIDCGARWKHKITRTHGVSLEQRQQIETMARASLGVKYLNNLETQIGSKVGRSVTLSHVSTEEAEFLFEVPNCFQRRYEIFQMRYDIRISCEWKPRLRKKRYWEASVSTYTNDIHQRSYLVPWHQQCGCGSAGGGPDIGLLQITAPDITLREPYLLTDDGLHLHTVGITVRTDGVVAYTGWEGTGGFDLQDELHRSWRTDRYELERKLVGMLVEHPHWLTYGVYPQHLRFLSGHSPEERVRVEFREIRDNPAMPPEPALSR